MNNVSPSCKELTECADNLNVYRRVVCKKMKVVQFYTSFIFFTICAISTVREIYHLHFEHRFSKQATCIYYFSVLVNFILSTHKKKRTTIDPPVKCHLKVDRKWPEIACWLLDWLLSLLILFFLTYLLKLPL